MIASCEAARRIPKQRPRLPPSAFTLSESNGTSESLLVSHDSPSFQHPDSVLDANVIIGDSDFSLNNYDTVIGKAIGKRMSGIVLFLPAIEDLEQVVKKFDTTDIHVVSLSVPFRLDDTSQIISPKISIPVSLHTIFSSITPDGLASLRWALHQNCPIDIDILPFLTDDATEPFGDFIQRATVDIASVPPIILSNLLPPPHLELPIVKLMNHPKYQEFQSQIISLALFPFVSVKFLPPSWNMATPPLGSAGNDITYSQMKEEKKSRLKMYLAPVLEAFGYQRIIFGSSSRLTSSGSPVLSDWYDVSRASLIELGVEREAVNAVFYGNALNVYDTAGREHCKDNNL